MADTEKRKVLALRGFVGACEATLRERPPYAQLLRAATTGEHKLSAAQLKALTAAVEAGFTVPDDLPMLVLAQSVEFEEMIYLAALVSAFRLSITEQAVSYILA